MTFSVDGKVFAFLELVYLVLFTGLTTVLLLGVGINPSFNYVPPLLFILLTYWFCRRG